VNLPLDVGAVDHDYQLVFDEIVLPILRQFEPDLLLVSAGFDAHERDPLAGMRLTSGAFSAMTKALRQVAAECCQGRIVLVAEGGYDLHAFAESLDGCVHALAGPAGEPWWPASPIRSARGRQSADAAKQRLGRYWKL
jgi:acetoin utilization deacetylase AcuC-like enzyme